MKAMNPLCRIRDIQRAVHQFELCLEERHGICLNEAMALCCLQQNERLASGELCGLLHRLVLSYARENRRPLDAVVVDDYGLDVDSLKSELADMISVMNESSMTYGRFLARDFVLMDVFGEVSSACHSILRERNLFTHDISQVQTVSYTPVDLPDSDDGSILLIPVSYVQN